ncbi:semaphorin-7A-like [Gymnodraco acuticeps]|uniref:Semaphorin-7A-like n=1 Tax=Gymnodraco acuticeps TaxID=8218 RepID=A0A6P8UKC6_GYMAC|nr:semaphorin-7A-like [Gymnodraco acuticeps]
MLLLLFKLYLLCSRLHTLTEATSKPAARMTFTLRETAMKRFPLLGHHVPAGIVLEKEPNTVISAEQKRLKSFNFQNPHETPVEIHVPWTECNKSDPQQTVKADCSFNIYLVQKMEANKLFLCGTDGKGTACCDMDLSEKTPRCMSSAKIQNIKKSIQGFIIKEGEPAALVESADSNLYVTYSGSKGDVGIHRFGWNRVGPTMHDREQHYVGLVPSRRRDDPFQGKVFGFYKEKNKDPDLYSNMWIPFVTRVCMGDRGGPKNFLQFSWTSQMNARLFCGEPESRRHFSELVDVATVEKEQWEDTRVYALFRNEWGMSAVCVYTIKDIERIFTTSTFKGKVPQPGRSRACVQDSSAIHMDVLSKIKENSEMEEWVWPVNNSGPILFNHHNYTHIYVDDSQNNRSDKHTVLYLSLHKGDIHKVVQKETETFIIAEYQPFHHRHHVLTFLLHPPTMKLYLTSRTELVQLDVGNCAQYGDRCGDCVLSRDPYCGWNGSHCTPHTQDMLQDVSRADHNICVSPGTFQHSQTVSKYLPARDDVTKSIKLPLNSKYFLQCPVSSHQARYTWINLERNTSWSLEDSPGLLLIPRMSPEQEGRYRCVSEERGYTRVLADYTLQLESRAGVKTSTSLLLGLCVTAALIQSLSC